MTVYETIFGVALIALVLLVLADRRHDDRIAADVRFTAAGLADLHDATERYLRAEYAALDACVGAEAQLVAWDAAAPPSGDGALGGGEAGSWVFVPLFAPAPSVAGSALHSWEGARSRCLAGPDPHDLPPAGPGLHASGLLPAGFSGLRHGAGGDFWGPHALQLRWMVRLVNHNPLAGPPSPGLQALLVARTPDGEPLSLALARRILAASPSAAAGVLASHPLGAGVGEVSIAGRGGGWALAICGWSDPSDCPAPGDRPSPFERVDMRPAPVARAEFPDGVALASAPFAVGAGAGEALSGARDATDRSARLVYLAVSAREHHLRHVLHRDPIGDPRAQRFAAPLDMGAFGLLNVPYVAGPDVDGDAAPDRGVHLIGADPADPTRPHVFDGHVLITGSLKVGGDTFDVDLAQGAGGHLLAEGSMQIGGDDFAGALAATDGVVLVRRTAQVGARAGSDPFDPASVDTGADPQGRLVVYGSAQFGGDAWLAGLDQPGRVFVSHALQVGSYQPTPADPGVAPVDSDLAARPAGTVLVPGSVSVGQPVAPAVFERPGRLHVTRHLQIGRSGEWVVGESAPSGHLFVDVSAQIGGVDHDPALAALGPSDPAAGSLAVASAAYVLGDATLPAQLPDGEGFVFAQRAVLADVVGADDGALPPPGSMVLGAGLRVHGDLEQAGRHFLHDAGAAVADPHRWSAHAVDTADPASPWALASALPGPGSALRDAASGAVVVEHLASAGAERVLVREVRNASSAFVVRGADGVPAPELILAAGPGGDPHALLSLGGDGAVLRAVDRALELRTGDEPVFEGYPNALPGPLLSLDPGSGEVVLGTTGSVLALRGTGAGAVVPVVGANAPLPYEPPAASSAGVVLASRGAIAVTARDATDPGVHAQLHLDPGGAGAARLSSSHGPVDVNAKYVRVNALDLQRGARGTKAFEPGFPNPIPLVDLLPRYALNVLETKRPGDPGTAPAPDCVAGAPPVGVNIPHGWRRDAHASATRYKFDYLADVALAGSTSGSHSIDLVVDMTEHQAEVVVYEPWTGWSVSSTGALVDTGIPATGKIAGGAGVIGQQLIFCRNRAVTP